MSEPYQLQCDAIRQRILAGDNLEVLFTVSAAIAVTQAAADTALTGSAHAAGPTGQDPTLDSSQSLPESAWCGRPPTPEEARDAEHRRREDEIAWEIQCYASGLVAQAWFDRSPEGPDRKPPRDRLTLSASARTRAHGTVPASWLTGRYWGWRAYVCLNCDWVGKLAPLYPDTVAAHKAEAAAHRCRPVVRKCSKIK